MTSPGSVRFEGARPATAELLKTLRACVLRKSNNLVAFYRIHYPSPMQRENLQELYPSLTAEELEFSRENLDRYLELAWEIAEESEDESLKIDGAQIAH